MRVEVVESDGVVTLGVETREGAVSVDLDEEALDRLCVEVMAARRRQRKRAHPYKFCVYVQGEHEVGDLVDYEDGEGDVWVARVRDTFSAAPTFGKPAYSEAMPLRLKEE